MTRDQAITKLNHALAAEGGGRWREFFDSHREVQRRDFAPMLVDCLQVLGLLRLEGE